MVIKILGSGCTNCQRLEALARKAVDQLGIEATVEHVTDYVEIMGYGIMSTPGLVIDEKVRMAGRVPSLDEIKAVLQS